MKTLATIILLMVTFIGNQAYSQSTYIETHELKFSPIESGRRISCEIESGNIEINGIEGDFIKLELEVYNAPGKNYQCLQDQCMLIDENFFHFRIKPREGEKIKRLSIALPKNTAIQLRNYGTGNITITKINKEIQINTMRVNDVTLKGVKGPLSVSGTYGNINIDFVKGFSKKTMAISLLKGNINVVIPKGEKITFATSCPDVASKNKDYPTKPNTGNKGEQNNLYTYNQSLLNKRSLVINANYQEKMETRDYFGVGKNKSSIKRENKRLYFNEDVWVYDINGGAGNIELKVYQGNIQIDENNN